MNRSTILEFEFSNWDNETGCNTYGSIVSTERSMWLFALLDTLEFIDVEKAIDWILSCLSYEDGSFRMYPGDNSNRIYFCRAAVHSLEIVNALTSLDSLFTVQESPVWEIPEWYLEKISSFTATIYGNLGGGILFPDLTWYVNGINATAPFLLCLIPIGYYVYVDRQENQNRREWKKRRKRLYRKSRRN